MFFDSLAPARLALRANLVLAFLKDSQPSRLCSLIHFVHSFGVAFSNLSPFGRLWLIPLNSVLGDLRKKQTLPRAGIHPQPDAFRRAVLAAMSKWRRGRGAESHAGGIAKWDRDRNGGRYP